MRQNKIYCLAEIRANAETNCCCGLAPRRDALVAPPCAYHESQASEPRLAASGLAAKIRVECDRVNLSWYFAFHNGTACLLLLLLLLLLYSSVVYEYVFAERCAPSATSLDL